MFTSNLRKVGGSVMLVVPPVMLEQLQLEAGNSVGLFISEGNLVINPRPKPEYTLDALLAASDYTFDTAASDDREWLDSPAVGGELL